MSLIVKQKFENKINLAQAGQHLTMLTVHKRGSEWAILCEKKKIMMEPESRVQVIEYLPITKQNLKKAKREIRLEKW